MNATRALREAMAVGARTATSSRSLLVATGALYAFVTVALGTLWRVGAQAAGGEVGGYGPDALFWYIAVAELCIVPVDMQAIERTGDAIASGGITPERLRPLPPLALRVARQYGHTLATALACLPVALTLGLVATGAPPAATGVLLALLCLPLALLLNVLGQHAFAAVAFWVRDTRGTWFLYQKLVFVLGGMVLPLQVLPGPIERIAHVLPFSAMAYVPARLASGHVEPLLVGRQLLALAGVAGVAAWLWRAGDRRLQEVGE